MLTPHATRTFHSVHQGLQELPTASGCPTCVTAVSLHLGYCKPSTTMGQGSTCQQGHRKRSPAQARPGHEGTTGARSRIKRRRCPTRAKEATGIFHSLKHTVKLQTCSCCQKSPGGTSVNPSRDQGCLPLPSSPAWHTAGLLQHVPHPGSVLLRHVRRRSVPFVICHMDRWAQTVPEDVPQTETCLPLPSGSG